MRPLVDIFLRAIREAITHRRSDYSRFYWRTLSLLVTGTTDPSISTMGKAFPVAVLLLALGEALVPFQAPYRTLLRPAATVDPFPFVERWARDKTLAGKLEFQSNSCHHQKSCTSDLMRMASSNRLE